MPLLPEEVIEFRKKILRLPDHELYDVTKKLTVSIDDLVRMWKTIERRSRKSDRWVYIFLQRVLEATKQPAYHLKNGTERREISDRIRKLASQLECTLRVNDLDAQLIYSNSENWRGFWFYDDFGVKLRAEIDYQGLDKLLVSRLPGAIAEHTDRLIQEAPKLGKAGKNVRAIRFARTMSGQNRRHFDTPLHAVTAAATNTLFGTHYGKSDINKLVTRFAGHKV